MSRALKRSVGRITCLLFYSHLDSTVGPVFLRIDLDFNVKLCNSCSQTVMCMRITQESSQICGLSFSRSAWGWRVCISNKLQSAVLPSCRCTGHTPFVQQVFTIEAPLGIHSLQGRALCLRKSTEQGEIWGWAYG